MAPCELRQEFAAARLRQEDRGTQDLIQAWHVVRIYVLTENQKQLPDLKTLIREWTHEPVDIQQVRAEQTAALHAISALYGLKVQRRKKRTVLMPHEAKPVTLKLVTKIRAKKRARR